MIYNCRTELHRVCHRVTRMQIKDYILNAVKLREYTMKPCAINNITAFTLDYTMYAAKLP